MVTKDLPLSLVATLTDTLYTTLNHWTKDQKQTKANGNVYIIKALVPSFKKGTRVWLTAESINRLIELGKIPDFTL